MLFLEVLISFAAYYFARGTSLQAAIPEVREGWKETEAKFTSPFKDSDRETYEVYPATFGKVVLRILRNDDSTAEYLVNMTLTPKEEPIVDVVFNMLSLEFQQRSMQLDAVNVWQEPEQKSYAVRLNNGPRTLELVISNRKVKMFTLKEAVTSKPPES